MKLFIASMQGEADKTWHFLKQFQTFMGLTFQSEHLPHPTRSRMFTHSPLAHPFRMSSTVLHQFSIHSSSLYIDTFCSSLVVFIWNWCNKHVWIRISFLMQNSCDHGYYHAEQNRWWSHQIQKKDLDLWDLQNYAEYDSQGLGFGVW